MFLIFVLMHLTLSIPGTPKRVQDSDEMLHTGSVLSYVGDSGTK